MKLNYEFVLMTSMLISFIISGINAQCPTIIGCSTCEDPNICTSCYISLKYHLTENKCVKSNVQNCRTLDRFGVCIDCNPFFYLAATNICHPVPPIINCLTYKSNATTPTCNHCKVGYNLINGKCENFIPNCLLTNLNEKTCNNCAFGFRWIFKQCAKTNTPASDCVIFDLSGKCQICSKGFYIDSSGICIKGSIDNCEEYKNVQNICLTCESKYYLSVDRSKCHRQNDAYCFDFIPNTSYCIKCMIGFAANKTGSCVSINQYTKYCHEISTVKLGCSLCIEKYFVEEDGICYPQNNTNCDKMITNENKCEVCRSGFYPGAKTGCLAQNVTNCKKFNQNSPICSECDEDYTLDSPNGICIETITILPKCYYADPKNDTFCFLCNKGFYSSNGDCLRQNIPNCIRNAYSFDLNRCTSCEKGYYALDGKCLPQNVPECQEYKENTNECIKCSFGSKLDYNSECSKITSCEKFIASDSNDCEECAVGFYLVNSYCQLQTRTACRNYVKNTNNCAECASGYFISDGDCVEQNIPNCYEYQDKMPFCLLCEDGYYIDKQKKCQKHDLPGCAQYLPQLNLCSECNLEYTLTDKNICQPPGDILNCDVYNDHKSSCLACKKGHFVSSDRTKCFVQDVADCKEFYPNQNSCRICQEDFQENSKTGTCMLKGESVRQILHCLKQVNQLCKICEFSFYSSENERYCQEIKNWRMWYTDSNENAEIFTVNEVSSVLILSVEPYIKASHNTYWEFKQVEGNVYTISTPDGLWDLSGIKNSLSIQPKNPDSLMHQWMLIQLSDGTFNIQNKSSSLYINPGTTLLSSSFGISLTGVYD